MRTAALLLATGAVLSACRTEENPPGAGAPAASATRDLTTQSAAATPVAVASPIELVDSRPPAPQARVAPRPRPRPAPRTTKATTPAPVPEPEASVVLAEPPPVVAPPSLVAAPPPAAPPADAAGSGRELAPGQTVTVIPASSGAAVEAEHDDSWLPSERPRGIIVGGGGTCRPRGGVRGIGIAGRIPVGVPTRRLR